MPTDTLLLSIIIIIRRKVSFSPVPSQNANSHVFLRRPESLYPAVLKANSLGNPILFHSYMRMPFGFVLLYSFFYIKF
jgi:hypothetical protein